MRINLKGFNQVTLEMMNIFKMTYEPLQARLSEWSLESSFFSLLFGWNGTVIVSSENLVNQLGLCFFFHHRLGLVVLFNKIGFHFLASVVL